MSLFWTWNTFDTLKEINILIWVMGAVYLFSLIENKLTALKAIVFGATILAVCAIVQSKVLFPKIIENFKGERYAEIVASQAIPFASFLYHNVFGGYMSFILPLCMYFGFYINKGLFKFSIIFIIAGLILSTSRIAMMISAAFLLFFVFILIKEKNIKNLIELILAVSISIFLVVVLLNTERAGDLNGLKSELTKKAHISKEEVKTLNTRTEIWKNAFNAFMAKPVVGFGAGATEYAYRKYFDGGIYTRYTHSVILKIGIELGIVGILFFLFYLVGVCYHSKYYFKEKASLFVFTSILCGFIFGVFDFSFDMPAHAITFFLISSNVFEDLKKMDSIEKNLKKPISLSIIALLLISFLFTTKTCLARKSIENARTLQENGFFIDAVQAYKDAIREMPLDIEGYIGFISLLEIQYRMEVDPQTKESIKELLLYYIKLMEKKNEKDSQLYFTLGLCYETLGNIDKAEYYLINAITYYPSSAQYLSEIVRFYLIRNRIEEAEKWAKKIDPYLYKYSTSKNPVGFYVFKTRDMMAEIELKKNNKIQALSITKENLHDVLIDKYLISNLKTGLIISKAQLKRYFEKRLQEIEKGHNGR